MTWASFVVKISTVDILIMKWFDVKKKKPPSRTHVLTYSPDIQGGPYRILPSSDKGKLFIDVTHWAFLEPPKNENNNNS